MKKIATFVLSISILFSFGKTFASDSLFEEVLNLDKGPFIYDLSLSKIDNYSFKDVSLDEVYNTFKSYDGAFKEEIIRAYDNGDYDYYEMNAIVRNYNSFVYSTNKFFYYLNLVDNNNNLKNDKNVQSAISRHYKQVNSNYSKVKNLLKK